MKVNILNSNSVSGKFGSKMERISHRQSVVQNKSIQTYPYYKNNNVPSSNVSFQGNLGTKILQSPKTHALLMRGKHNPLLVEALFSILITCGLRPLTIMATAGKDEENKQKCKMQVAKSFSTGLVGLAATFVVTKPLSDAIKKFAGHGSKNVSLTDEMAEQVENVIKPANEYLKNSTDKLEGYLVKNMQGKTIDTTIENIVATKGAKESLKEFSQEIFERVEPAIKAQKSINKYRSTMCDLLNKVICPVFSPAKAVLTISLVPVIVGLLFKNQDGEQKAGKDQKTSGEQNTDSKTQQNIPDKSLNMPSEVSKVFSDFGHEGRENE